MGKGYRDYVTPSHLIQWGFAIITDEGTTAIQMLAINFTGVYLSAVSCARQMIKYRTPGAMCLIGSMSGLIANKGFTSSVYNSSKAAVIQLGRSLAMEWGIIKEFEDIEDNTVGASAAGGSDVLEHLKGKKRGIRVNVLCPGNIMTPVSSSRASPPPHCSTLPFQMKKSNL